ncbi:MAG: quinol:cytochrome C oxidoreductase [Bacteroidia bacterium]
MAHTHTEFNVEEKYLFSPALRKRLLWGMIGGVAVALIGILLLLGESSHHGPVWLRRLAANLLINSMYFLGISILALFFLGVGYASNASWYIALARIPQAMTRYFPIGAGFLAVTVVAFLGVLYEWSHAEAVAQDEILQHKKGYLNIPFFIARLGIILGAWWLFLRGYWKNWERESLHGGMAPFLAMRRLSAGFLVFFALSWSVASWDWLMSTSPHWFSTMFAVYNFANLWITALCFITFYAIYLKSQNYLSFVNPSHIHDLGKFVFAFSIFWTYIFYGQFMLIWYANIPEETFWFYERIRQFPQYLPIFYTTIILNFLLPLVGLMSASIKRNKMWLGIVTAILMVTHWLDTYMVVMPSVAGESGGIGLLEVGLYAFFWSLFGWVTAQALTRFTSLASVNHPYWDETVHHAYEPM